MISGCKSKHQIGIHKPKFQNLYNFIKQPDYLYFTRMRQNPVLILILRTHENSDSV